MQDSITLGHCTLLRACASTGTTDSARPPPLQPRARRLLPAQADRHGAPRRLLPHAGNPVQREPDALQLHRRRRTRHQRLRRLETRPSNPAAAISTTWASSNRSAATFVDADYFWKFTDNAFDFDTLLNTPHRLPDLLAEVQDRRRLRCASAPPTSTACRPTRPGPHSRRYFAPSNGGLIFNSPLDTSVFRIDHDQAFQQTTHLLYRRPHNGPWVAFTWRYDSGLVAGAVGSLDDALGLTAAQQAAIGFYCGSQFATPANPIAACAFAELRRDPARHPAAGTAIDDHNPPRIAPRHLFDLGGGTDNLFHTERVRTTLKMTVTNLTNHVALYNFLSTFSGTHFVSPRAYQMELGWTW